MISLSEAWSILDQIYGQKFDLRNKLKHEFLVIKLAQRSHDSLQIKFEKFYKLSAKNKVSSGHSFLEYEFEFISFV